MGNRNLIFNIMLFLSVSTLIVIAVYSFDAWFIERWREVRTRMNFNFSVTDLLFFEGLVSILFGFLLLLGRGGINRWTMETVLKTSIADWLYGKESDKERIRPSEIFRVDRWKSKGFIRFALILMLSGIFMILIYFLTL